MPKISVIVPVYNVEPYLEKCVESVLAQTEADWELLLIDDGSTDQSGALCDTLAGQDARIQVIHQENQGLGGARNTGIGQARGDWLLFVDSDDWIDPQTLEKSLEAATREEADLVVFGLRNVDEQGRELGTLIEEFPKDRGLSIRERRDLLLMAPCACAKLYRADLFRRTGVRFPPRVWYEDMRTTPKLMIAAQRIVFLDFAGYNYLQRQGSITRNVNADRNREILDAFDDLLAYFQEQGELEHYRDELCYLTLFHAYLAASVRVLRADRRHRLLGEFAAYLRERFPDYRENKYLPRLGKNRRLILSLLERKQYFLVALIFKVKG